MSKVYKDPPYSGWREFIMWVGMTPLVIAGLIVGKRYFNRVLHEMDSMDFYIKPDTPGFEKGWVEEDTQTEGETNVQRDYRSTI